MFGKDKIQKEYERTLEDIRKEKEELIKVLEEIKKMNF